MGWSPRVKPLNLPIRQTGVSCPLQEGLSITLDAHLPSLPSLWLVRSRAAPSTPDLWCLSQIPSSFPTPLVTESWPLYIISPIALEAVSLSFSPHVHGTVYPPGPLKLSFFTDLPVCTLIILHCLSHWGQKMQISSCYSLLQSLHWLPTATWSKPYNIEGPFQTILLKSGTSSPWHIHICFPLHLSPSEMYIFYLCALCQSLPFKGNNAREEMSVFCLLLYLQSLEQRWYTVGAQYISTEWLNAQHIGSSQHSLACVSRICLVDQKILPATSVNTGCYSHQAISHSSHLHYGAPQKDWGWRKQGTGPRKLRWI